MEFTCNYCGKIYHECPSRGGKFCSYACRDKSRQKRQTCNCDHCGKQFDRIVSEYFKRTEHFCSKECHWNHKRKAESLEELWCGNCKQSLPVDEFNPRKPRKGRRRNHNCYCKKCWRYRKNTPRYRYTNSIRSAKKRNLEWNIEEAAYHEMVSPNKCYYCDGLLNLFGTNLDRIDNTKGYIIGNVVPCCGSCNMMRGDRFSHEEMKLFIPVLREIQNRRTTCGETKDYQI